ncbi:MAG: hypothetical protein HY420_04835 [Candidatus Kerfeldbacteria bacterium]|nr:hypothetical protein [Candidatus Kerfeldbacteria bacterium]
MKILLLNADDKHTERVQALLTAAGHTVEVTWEDSAGIQACRRFQPEVIIACGGGNLDWFMNALKRERMDQYPVMLVGETNWRSTNMLFRDGVKSVIPPAEVEGFIFWEIWEVTGVSIYEIDGSRQKRQAVSQ